MVTVNRIPPAYTSKDKFVTSDDENELEVKAGPIRGRGFWLEEGRKKKFGMWQSGKGAGLARIPDHPRQQVAIVMPKVQTTWGGKRGWSGFGTYLTRKGKQQEERKGVGFNAEGNVEDMSHTIRQWQEEGDGHFFDVVVSLGDLKIDLQEFTRRLIEEKVEPALGTKVEWMAIDHHDKAHKHVHIVIRGSVNGQELRIDESYLWGVIRQQARELATQMGGWRSEEEIKNAQERSLKRPGWNGIDEGLKHKSEWQALQEERLSHYEQQRLQTLKDRGLAWQDERGSWALAQRWEEDLRAEGREKKERQQEHMQEEKHEHEFGWGLQ